LNWVAIANPMAGRAREVERASSLLRDAGLVSAVHGAVLPGDGAALPPDAVAADGLVVVGGDGTVLQVINAMDRARQTLAVIPCGHGNCLARDLGVAQVGRAIEALRTGHTIRIDLMHMQISAEGQAPRDWFAASTLAAGYVADTATFGRTQLAVLGRHAYAAASVLTRPRHCRVRVGLTGGLPALPLLTGVVINNTAHLANFLAFHNARFDDGLLDVMEQGYGWPRQLLHNAAVLFGSSRFGPARLTQTTSLSLAFDEPDCLMVDGEMLQGVRQVDVCCEPRALACVCGVGLDR
jgi:diacylglycerol kinase family enzyme